MPALYRVNIGPSCLVVRPSRLGIHSHRLVPSVPRCEGKCSPSPSLPKGGPQSVSFLRCVGERPKDRRNTNTAGIREDNGEGVP